jgi:hypothetical protein
LSLSTSGSIPVSSLRKSTGHDLQSLVIVLRLSFDVVVDVADVDDVVVVALFLMVSC